MEEGQRRRLAAAGVPAGLLLGSWPTSTGLGPRTTTGLLLLPFLRSSGLISCLLLLLLPDRCTDLRLQVANASVPLGSSHHLVGIAPEYVGAKRIVPR